MGMNVSDYASIRFYKNSDSNDFLIRYENKLISFNEKSLNDINYLLRI